MGSDRAFGERGTAGDADPNGRPTIDPRYHDAALIGVDGVPGESASELTRRLREAGVRVGVFPGGADPRPGRTAVLVDCESKVAAARAAGFGLVIGLDRTGESAARLRQRGADHVVDDLSRVQVRTIGGRMSELPDALRSFTAVAEAMSQRRPAIFFDFDGTLSPIVDQPESAALTPGAEAALRALAARCPVGVLSGRDLADVEGRVGIPGLWYAGSHGFEMVDPHGSCHRNDTAAQAIPLLRNAADELAGRLSPLGGVSVEHKRYAVAVHYRNAGAGAAAAVTAAVHDVGKRLGLKVTAGRMVVELRPDVAWDKGRTLNWIVERISGEQPVLPVFLGDDLTDEDGFDAVRDDGIGIVVRHSEDGDRATNARLRLDDPEAVRRFIERLVEQTGPRPA